MFAQLALLYKFIVSFIRLRAKDFKVTRIELEYTHNGTSKPKFTPRLPWDVCKRVLVPPRYDAVDEITTPFWNRESKYWGTYEFSYWADVTNVDKNELLNVPENVSNTRYTFSYQVDGIKYRYITKDPNVAWPPTKKRRFIMLISKVMLLDEDDNPVRDVTNTVKKYAGYYGDFHGVEEITIDDVILYDDYTKVRVTNALGITKTVDRYASILQLL